MKRWILPIALALLCSLTSFCFASATPSSDDSLSLSLGQVSFARSMAVNYVLNLKEAYGNTSNDPLFQDAKIKYQIVAAKFTGLRSTVTLNLLYKKDFPQTKDAEFKALRTDALAVYYDFEKSARAALRAKAQTELEYRPQDSPSSTTTEENTNRSSLSNIFTLVVNPDTLNIIKVGEELWLKHLEAKAQRATDLSKWLDAYWSLPEWYSIGTVNKDTSTK